MKNLFVKGDEARVSACRYRPDGAMEAFSLQFPFPLAPSAALVMHSARDIGRVAAQALAEGASGSSPGPFQRAAVRLVGDHLSLDRAVEVLQEDLGVRVQLSVPASADTARVPDKFAQMFAWLNRAHLLPENQECELLAAQAALPGLPDFRAWLATQGSALIRHVCNNDPMKYKIKIKIKNNKK